MKPVYYFFAIVAIASFVLLISLFPITNTGKSIESLPHDIVLNKNEQPTFNKFYGESIIQAILLPEGVETSSDGEEYIIVLNEDPVISAKKENAINAINKVSNEQAKLKSNLEKRQVSILKKTSKASNTMLVKSSYSNIKKLKDEGQIKEYYPNIKITSFLDQSTEYLELPDIWYDPVTPYTGKGVIVGVVDTGIDYTHPALGGCLGAGCKVIGGYDFVNDDNDPMDDNFHGTHVASTVAGNDPNGLKGVAPGASLVGLKVLAADGAGNLYDILLAYDYSIDLNQNGIPFENDADSVDILSMSLGAPYNSPDHPLAIATDEMMKKGVLTVIAAGNTGPANYSIGLPGSATEALTVGASGNFYGRTSALAADGVEVESTAGFNTAEGIFSGPIFDAGTGTNLAIVPQNSIALVRRGSVSFNELVINAENYGIKAIILVNSQDALFNPIIFYNSSVMFAAVKSSDEQTLLSASQVSLIINYSDDFANSVAPFSSRGPTPGINATIIKPDVLAPGYFVCAASTYNPSNSEKCFDGRYISIQGTSMATPHVSGFAALLKEAKPDWDSFMLRDAIKSSSKKIDYSPIDQGFGRVIPKNLFDENRSIILNGSLSFNPFRNKSAINITIMNPSSSSVTYTFSSQIPYLQAPSELVVGSNSNKTLSINISSALENILGYLDINDSNNNSYSLPVLSDPNFMALINIDVPINMKNQFIHYFLAAIIYDKSTNQRVFTGSLRMDSEGRATVYYPYSQTDDLEVMVYAYLFDYNNTENETDIFQIGEQRSYYSFKDISVNMMFDFSQCTNHRFNTSIDIPFGSLFTLTSEYDELPAFGMFDYIDKSYNASNISQYKDVRSISRDANFCLFNMPDYIDYNLVTFAQEGNEMYVNKFLFDEFSDSFEVPHTYANDDSITFGMSDDDNLLYPTVNFRYLGSNIFMFNSYEAIQPVNTSIPLNIYSNMDEGSFNNASIELQFYADAPEINIRYFSGQPSLYYVLSKPFFVLNSYNYYNQKRYLFTSMRPIDGSGVLLTKYLQYGLGFSPDSLVLHNQPNYFSQIYELSPGNLNFYSNYLSESNHHSITPDFFESLVGLSVYMIKQSTDYVHVSTTNSYFDYQGTVGPIDLNLPFTVYMGYPTPESIPPFPDFTPYAKTMNSNYFNTSHVWHTTMDELDANPPSLVDVDVSFNNMRFVIADENLSTVLIFIDEEIVNHSLVGQPFNVKPVTNYEKDHTDYFKIVLPDNNWHKITIFANDTTGNWFNQSFQAKSIPKIEELDFNSDNGVEINDLFEIAIYYRLDSSSPLWDELDNSGRTIGVAYDLNSDGKINVLDLVILVSNYS